MSKEIYISTTPHETRLAIVEDEQLAEVYYERENEYTLAGSIYNGKVTRVLPGMQSSFVDIGLERDAFLYVTDFMEEAGDSADFETDGGGSRRTPAPREAVAADTSREPSGRREDTRRGRTGRGDRGERGGREQAKPVSADPGETPLFEEPVAPRPTEPSAVADVSGDETVEEQGSRRWRGRRGRRRGRGGREGGSPLLSEAAEGTTEASGNTEFVDAEPERLSLEGSAENLQQGDFGGPIEIDVQGEPRAPQPGVEQSGRGRDGRRGGRDDNRRGGRRRDDTGRGGRRNALPVAETVPDEELNDSDAVAEPYGSAEPESSAEAIVLPGESIRKYRDPAQVAAEDEARRASAPAFTQTVVSAPPIEIVGWDGGATLPGETMSRHRTRGRGASDEGHSSGYRQERGGGTAGAMQTTEMQPTELHAQALVPVSSEPAYFQQPARVEETMAPSPIADVEDIAAAAAPEETGGLTQHPAHADESAAVGPIVDLEASAAAEPQEYEPAEGEAASLGDAGRRDYRFLEQKPAEPAVDPEVLAFEPDATTYDLAEATHDRAPELAAEPVSEQGQHDFTTVSSDGEMVSEPEQLVDDAQHLPVPQDATDGTQDMASLGATRTEPVDAEAFMQSAVLAGQRESRVEHREESNDDRDGDSADDEPMHDGTLVAAPDDAGSETPFVRQVHAYGEGDLEEEEVDGDEYDYDLSVGAGDDDEVEDYEEETLDGDSGLDSVMEEMSLDGDETDEDTDEESDEQLPYAMEPSESAAGGFTVDDFGGEPSEAAEATATGGERRGRREGGRDGRRGGRDRDRRPGGGFRGGASAAAGGGDRGRGRGRQSVQTMDLPAINELLKPGQEVLLQIAKEPIAKKGARVTSHIALPGRFLVFMPTVNHTGVSRKISSDEERRRLKTILLSEKGDAQGGFIVRTAAEGASEEELRNDLRFLIQLWQDIKARSESSKSPALIYHDLSLIERILRDQVTDNFSAIWVDTEAEYERVLRFLQRFQPSLVRRVKLYTKETPLFEHFGVTAEIDKALKSKVWLKSGGSIVIDQTEALVAIDINTGKYVGKTARLEDTILKTNLDAIPEIVRQIRLRDLGGIIVIDFIDMDERKNRAKVMQVLEEELKSDRAPSKVLPFNDFGLVIMTRKRVKQSLERTLCIPDPITDGTGMIKSPITVANEIYVEMRKMQRHFEKSDVMLRVHPEVVKTLKLNGGKRLQELEDMTRKTILVKSDPTLAPEQFDIH